MSWIKRFWNDERGLETVEYAIIAGLIVIGTVALIASIGDWVLARFTKLDSELSANP